MHHNKQTNITMQFANDDLRSIGVQATGYNPGITFNLRDDTTVAINFKEGATEALEILLNTLISAAIKADWTEKYGSGYAYPEKPTVTIEMIRAWMEQESSPEPF